MDRAREASLSQHFPHARIRSSVVEASRECVEMPGLRWVLAAIYLWFVVFFRAVLYVAGINVDLRLLSQVGYSAVSILIIIGLYKYSVSGAPASIQKPGFSLRLYAWLLFVFVLMAYGIVRENQLDLVVKEADACLYVYAALVMGIDDRFWRGIEKPLTYLFFLSALLVILYSAVPDVTVTADLVNQDTTEEISARHIETLGYAFRPATFAGYLVGVWGLAARKKSWWTRFQTSALFVVFICDVGLFAHRSVAIELFLIYILSITFVPLLTRRAINFKKLLMVTLLMVSGAIYFLSTSAGELLVVRFTGQAEREGLFGSRNEEIQAFSKDMGWELAVGRGLGGTFDESAQTDLPERAAWPVLHYGIMVWLLKGGVLMLLLFCSFCAVRFWGMPRDWYMNPYNLTAAILIPVYLSEFVSDPLNLSVEGMPFLLATMMCFARFWKVDESVRRPAPSISTS